MSLYNMLHGVNPLKDILLLMLDIDQKNGKWASGRFRDIYLNADGTRILLYTRNGGGNREHWDDDKPAGEDCRCSACCIGEHLPKHPNYLSDYDDDFDCTYATIEFSVPENFAQVAAGLATGENPKTVHEKFADTMKQMETMSAEQLKADPRFGKLADILGDIVKALDEGKSGVVGV